MIKKEIVVVGISGGVDSSVAAYLLKQNVNYEVIGVFMRNWDSNLNHDFKGHLNNDETICDAENDYQDALAIANQLGIKLKRIDFIDQYWNLVFKKTLEDYKNGLTPNPDIWCNKYIKFNLFYKYAKEELNAKYIATGHYANIQKMDDEYYLTIAKDIKKDQTYFLSQIKKEYLKDLLFPLANLLKSEVRIIAKNNNLITATKKDSTGICFIGERNFKHFLENYLEIKKGNIIDIKTNKKIGVHDGTYFYTIGQRKGLNLNGNENPYFVVDKNENKNIVYVSNEKNSQFLFKQKAIINQLNFMTYYQYFLNKEIEVKVRHSLQKHLAKLIKIDDEKYLIDFKDKVRALTPGQSAVFYDKNICLGGGIFETIL